MVNDMQEIRNKLKSIDMNYYDNLALNERYVNDELIKEAIIDHLKQAEKEFKKRTKDGNMRGIVYRSIAKRLLDTL